MKSEITLPASDLKTALNGFNKLVSRKATLPVLACIKVTRTASGDITLQGTDLDGFATYTVDGSQPGEPIDVLLPLEQVNKAFKGSRQGLALLVDGNAVKLRYSLGSSSVEQPVNAPPIGEWPPIPTITTPSSPLEPGFGVALKQAMESCSTDSSRHVLQGACLDAREKSGHYIVGTNGRMLFAANSFNFPLKDAVIVRDSKFITGSGLLDSEPCFFALQPGKKPTDPKHILLQNQRWQFVSREIDGQFPNWKQVIPTIDNKWTKITLPPTAVEQLLEIIPKLPGADRENKDIRLIIEKDLSIEGRSKDDEFGTIIPIPDAVIQGKPRFICLSRVYVLNALKFGLNEWAIEDELTPFVASKAGKRMVIMPIRPSGSTSKPTPPITPEPVPVPERKPDMPKTSKKAESTQTTTPSLIDQVEQIKDSLKQVVHDLSDLVDAVKDAEKQKRSQEKEVEQVRTTLKKLQQVTI